MTSLRELQLQFRAAIQSGDNSALQDLIVNAGFAVERRIQVYRNNIRWGALAAMQAMYPVIERLAGADWFAQSIAQFQQEYPSRSGDLQELGANYPDFMAHSLKHGAFAYFADVARLEWCYQLVLLAAESDPVDLGVLRGFEPEDYPILLFVPCPAVRLVKSPFPILSIWRAHQSVSGAPETISLDAGESRVLLIRRHDHVELRELGEGSFELLRRFLEGEPLGRAAAVAGKLADFDLTNSLRELLGLETICEIVPQRSQESVRH